MTLKDELSKLYSESTASKQKQFLDNLPGLLREKAKQGRESATIYASDVAPIGLYLGDITNWCARNGLESKLNIWSLDPYITIYWG